MNLLQDIEKPILDVLTRIYKRNGQYVQTTRKYHKRKVTK